MIRNQITLKQIEALVYVADLGTFRKAASALGTTQPNISVRIAAIEETLNVVLMRRDAGTVRLTAKGQEILTAARAILRSTETLLEVAGRRDLIEEKLRLGVTELVASTWLPDFLRALKRTYPALRVELVVDLSRTIEEQLSSGEIDLGILNGRFRQKGYKTIALGSYRYGWFAAPEIGQALGETPSFATLFAQGVLSHDKHTAATKSLHSYMAAQGLSPDAITHSSSLNAMIHMAIDGMGIALVPRQLCKGPLAARQLVEVACPWLPEPLAFQSCYNTAITAGYVAQAAAMAVDVAKQDKA